MTRITNRPFDWIAFMAIVSGIAVMVPSFLALGASILAVFAALF